MLKCSGAVNSANLKAFCMNCLILLGLQTTGVIRVLIPGPGRPLWNYDPLPGPNGLVQQGDAGCLAWACLLKEVSLIDPPFF